MAAFETKTYPNVLMQIGATQEEIAERLREVFHTFFEDETERIYHDGPEDTGYLVDTGNIDARTEGMSYGMMMCVQLGRKDLFDRIWKWAKTYMYMEEGENEGYFAWSCALDGKKNAYGPAPDGEEFFAMALFFASHRWGDGEGIYCYSQEARAILRACLHKGEKGRPGAAMWNRENAQILFVPGCPFTDPSYHLPHFYELFALWADEEDRPFWKRAAQASRAYLAKACHPETGLNPEYGRFDGSPMADPMPWGGTHGDFYSDAYRTAANIGLDAVWFGEDAGQMGAPLRMMKFFGTDLEAVRCVYTVDGKPLEQPVLHPLGLLAGTAQGALAVLSDDASSEEDREMARTWVRWFWNQPLRKGVRRYYDNCLYLFALLALSGNYRIW
ncbi:MAG: xylanase [Lachnospiraceae bacterium]|nr:xylanase [Lachnospiraceae bacterium]